MEPTFYFNLKKSPIFVALKWEKFPLFSLAKIAKIISFILGLVPLLFYFFGYFFEKTKNQKFLGLCLIFISIAFFFQIAQSFFNQRLKNPKIKIDLKEIFERPENYNLADFFDFETAKEFLKLLKFTKSKKISKIYSLTLLYFLLDNPKLQFIFQRTLLDSKKIKEYLKNELISFQSENFKGELSREFQKTIFDALKIAIAKNHKKIKIEDIFLAVSKNNETFQKILIDLKLKNEDIEYLIDWLEEVEIRNEKNKKFWEYENLLKYGSLAKEWTAGYTINLDRFSTDLTERIKMIMPETIGHEQELKSMEVILSKREKNNVLLVGEPGTGRKSTIYELTKRSFLGKSLPELNYKRVVELNMAKLLSEIPSLEELEVVLNTIFQEVVFAGNVILVINDLHNYVHQIPKAGMIDISGILAPFLNEPNFKLIAVTTYAGLHQYLEQNPSFLSLFEKVEIPEVGEKETLKLLQRIVPYHEKTSKIFISWQGLKEIVFLSGRYLTDYYFPEKAIKLLDEAVVYTKVHSKERILLPEHVQKIITQKTQILVGEIEEKEKEVLINLDELIHQRIINQEEAVKEISAALRRARAEITVRKGPIGCFLFLGPTGVGKTETSKALADIYFGSEKRMIRLDMSEFQAISDISRLLGGPGQEGLLTTPVRENPFSLVLLDELEKAHPNILNLFLQVLDEGHLTDGQGRKVNFKNTIIIATSNAGYQVVLEALKTGREWKEVKEIILDFLFKEGIFRPEFINRFDGVIVFKPLSKENLLDIAQLLLEKLKNNLKEKGIEFIINKELKEKIVELGYDPKFGAREMRRVIQDKVENVLAIALLKGEIKRGDKIEILPENFEIKKF